MAGQALQLSSITLTSAAGTITGSGAYDLHTEQFQVNAQGNGIDIAKIDSCAMGRGGWPEASDSRCRALEHSMIRI